MNIKIQALIGPAKILYNPDHRLSEAKSWLLKQFYNVRVKSEGKILPFFQDNTKKKFSYIIA